MPTSLPQHDPKRTGGRSRPLPGRENLLPATVIVPLMLAVLAGAVPQPLVLPAISVLLVPGGLALALYAWQHQSRSAATADHRLDIAGGLVLVGFGAAMLADPAEALRSLAELQAAVTERPNPIE